MENKELIKKLKKRTSQARQKMWKLVLFVLNKHFFQGNESMRYPKEKCGFGPKGKCRFGQLPGGGYIWQCSECGAFNLIEGEEIIADWTVEKCSRCQKMFLIGKPHEGKEDK